MDKEDIQYMVKVSSFSENELNKFHRLKADSFFDFFAHLFYFNKFKIEIKITVNIESYGQYNLHRMYIDGKGESQIPGIENEETLMVFGLSSNIHGEDIYYIKNGAIVMSYIGLLRDTDKLKILIDEESVEKFERDLREKSYEMKNLIKDGYEYRREKEKELEMMKKFDEARGKREDARYIRTKKEKQKTYIMLDGSTGFYKIGRSYNPKLRESTLRAEKPTIKMLYVSDNDFEKELHKLFNDKRVRGEWFNLQGNDIFSIVNNYSFKQIAC